MSGYIVHIERETLENTDYRRVLFTTPRSQLVLMSIPPNEEIGEEVHHLDQFIRIEEGEATVTLDGDMTTLMANDAVVIPAGTRHNVENMGPTDLKLYTLYTPPEHKDGTVHQTKEEAGAHEEHWDGGVSLGVHE